MNNNYDETNQNKGYSGEYTPNGTKYTGNTYVYENGVYRGQSAKGKRSRSIFLIALVSSLIAVLALVLTLFLMAKYFELVSRTSKGDLADNDVKQEVQAPSFLPPEDDIRLVISETAPTPTKGSVGDADLTLSDVVSLVRDTVVEIVTSEAYRNGLVYESGAGSGVIVNDSGMILTNYHVIESASVITVRLTNGNTYEASLVASDAESDLAIIKIEPNETLSSAVFGKSENVLAGESVIAIGNPLGLLGGTVTDGIISATSREVSVDGQTMTLLQHNAAISPGNSGGALFNMRGELIGIVNAKYSSSGAEGLGFAIPADTAVKVYGDLINYGYVKGRPDTGVKLGSKYYSYFSYVICVTESRYTDELKPNDLIVSIDGVIPTSLAEAEQMLRDHKIGDTVTIVVSRTEGRTEVQHSVTITVREYEP